MKTMPTNMTANKTGKLLFKLAVGAALGFFAGFGFESLVDIERLASDQVMVSFVGLSYSVMGLIVGFGVIAPKWGARILNVQDTDDIRDQRRILAGSAFCAFILGAALTALAMAGPGGILSPLASFGGLVAALAIQIVISIRDWKLYDEMYRALTRDAGNLSFLVIGGVLMIWSSAAWVGLVAGPTPLGLIALVSGGFLVAMFVVAARRGLMHSQ